MSSIATSIPPRDITFLICIEANALKQQGMLLCESIRRFAGRYAACRIVAVSPRPNLALSPSSVRALKRLGVRYVALNLNTTGSPYGTINRVVVGRWAEKTLKTAYLVALDTDMLFVAEPDFPRVDVGVRPVDMKGSATAAGDDPLDAYWGRMCDDAGILLDDLPMLESTVSRDRLRASYNGGFAVVRRDLGVLTAAATAFEASFARDDRPLRDMGLDVFASTGQVGVEGSEWWGSSQAALSMGIWSTTRDVLTYDDRYNIPLHLVAEGYTTWPLEGGKPILLHYHYLTRPEHRSQLPHALAIVNCPPAVTAWLMDALSSPAPDAPRSRRGDGPGFATSF